MIVVSDTSPILYLLLIGEIDLLLALFETVTVPEAVATELSHPSAPAGVKEWIASPPPWLRIESGGPEGPEEPVPRLAALDRGERDAILLAQRLGCDLLILDDKPARAAAEELGLRVTGALGVLEAAARRGLVDLPAAVARLRKTNFRAAPALLRQLLERSRRPPG